MAIQGSSVSSNFGRSMDVLRSPREDTLTQYEQQGDTRMALTYAAVAAVIAGVIAFLFGLLSGFAVPGASPILIAFLRLLVALVTPLGALFIYAFAFNWMSRQQGSTRSQDTIFYTTSLFVVPIIGLNAAVSAIPKLGCVYQPTAVALMLYVIYVGHIFARSDSALDQNRTTMVTIAAGSALAIFLLVMSVLYSVTAVAGPGAATACLPLLPVAGAHTEILNCPLSLNF